MPDNTRVPPARAAAVKVLMECIGQGKPLHNLSAHPLMRVLSIADRSLASEIIYGVLRNLLRCDYLIRRHSETRFSRIDPEVLWIIRIAVYQLEFMSAPDYAVVDDAVRLTRHLGRSSASGFVNGVLRSFLRRRHPLPPGNSVSSLAVRYSHPEWLVRRYVSRFGVKRARKIMTVNNRVPESYLRINTAVITPDEFSLELDREGISHEFFPSVPGCFKIGRRGFNRHRLYREGYCFYMDYGSQLVAARVEAEPGMKIGDFCAAPGGKSFILSARTGPGGMVFASDISLPRLLQMKQRMAFYRINNCSLVRADLESSPPPCRGLDVSLLDVPCSGLGTVRSNPDIRWLFKEDDLLKMQSRQAAVLGNCFKLLERGRKIYYSTCSTEPEENEDVIAGLLLDEPSAELEGEPFYTLAGQDEGEGFFMAVIRKA